MNQGFYGFPRLLDVVRATTFKAIGKAGATGGAALAGGTASGAPVAPAGPFDVGDMIVDATGKLWICTTAGTSQSSPGSFTQVGGATSPLTTKGDVWVYGSADARLGVGSNDQVLIADSTQTLGMRWGAAPAGTGGLLAVWAYAAATDSEITSTSTSFVDVDATNHAITFTAPTSGNVLVRVSGLFQAQNATNSVFFGLREGSSNVASSSRLNGCAANATNANQTLAFSLSGLAAGSHTLKLSWRTSNAGTNVGLYSGPTYGQTVYEVWPAP